MSVKGSLIVNQNDEDHNESPPRIVAALCGKVPECISFFKVIFTLFCEKIFFSCVLACWSYQWWSITNRTFREEYKWDFNHKITDFVEESAFEHIVNHCVQVSHYDDVIMGAIASQITSLTIVYSAVYSDADQRKHQSSAPLAFVWGIHRGPVNSLHKWPVTRKMLPFDDVIMMLNSPWSHLNRRV